MKKIFLYTMCVGLFFSCGELTDFTDVENPNLTEESIVGQPNSSILWLTGMERQLSLTLNEIVINAEIVSDNYVNTQTFYNQFLDALDIQKIDDDIEDLQFDIHRLREMADFGLESIGPGDENYSDETRAEYTFMRGMSSLWSAMYFSGLPGEPAGPVLSAEAHLTNAVNDFNNAISIMNNPQYHLALARAYYLQGNQSMATSTAQDAIDAGADLRVNTFDEANGPANTMESALYERGTFDDLQPLPSLDFLDPKYSFFSAAEDMGINYLKVEEAHLILCEAAIKDGDIPGAQSIMTDILGLVGSRPMVSVDDAIEGRTEIAPGSRPDSACVEVNGRAGLVLERGEGPVMVPGVSGASLTQAEIDAISTEDEALYLLYRTRQEIFMAEGMRMVDMGIKFVIGETEELLNENVGTTGLGTAPQIPSFIAAAGDIDAFEYDADNCTATISVDVTQLLVDNKADGMVLPFH